MVVGPELSAGTVNVRVLGSTRAMLAAWPPTVAVVDALKPLPLTVICVPGDAVSGLSQPIETGASPRSTMVKPLPVIKYKSRPFGSIAIGVAVFDKVSLKE